MPFGPRNSAPLVRWLDQIGNMIPSLEDVSQWGHKQPTIGGKLLGYGIDAASQVGRPIGAIAGAAGNLFSEAQTEETRKRALEERYGKGASPERTDIPSALDAAMTEQATSPLEARKAINVLDVASAGAGMGAGALAKTVPTVAKVLGLADVGLSAADASFGGAQVATGVEDKDWAKVAGGVARVAGNVYGGKKAIDDLRSLGIKIDNTPVKPQADDPLAQGVVNLRPRVLSDKSKQAPSLMAKDTSGENFTVEVNSKTGSSQNSPRRGCVDLRLIRTLRRHWPNRHSCFAWVMLTRPTS